MPIYTDDTLEDYYAKLTDILAVFWEYHKARLAAGTMAFGLEYTRPFVDSIAMAVS